MKRRVVLFQSRIVRNVNPTFIWVLKRDVIDYRFLTKEQMVNHYCKAGSFTTKVSTEKTTPFILLYTNIDQTLVNSLHKLLNCEIGGLDCHVITCIHCIHMYHLFCNAYVHVIYLGVSCQCSRTILILQEALHLIE